MSGARRVALWDPSRREPAEMTPIAYFCEQVAGQVEGTRPVSDEPRSGNACALVSVWKGGILSIFYNSSVKAPVTYGSRDTLYTLWREIWIVTKIPGRNKSRIKPAKQIDKPHVACVTERGQFLYMSHSQERRDNDICDAQRTSRACILLRNPAIKYANETWTRVTRDKSCRNENSFINLMDGKRRAGIAQSL